MRYNEIIQEARHLPSVEPQWWIDGKIIPEDQMGFDGYDMHEFMEGEEFDYEWRLCRVPMALLWKIAINDLPRDSEDQHIERVTDIRSWYDSAGIDGALSKRPPILLLHGGKIVRLLDGWHRVAIAQERGAQEFIAAVGYGRGEPAG